MKFPPLITLLLLTTIVPELMTGSTPLAGFFNPGLLIFLFLGYGVAILLMREFAVRFDIQLRGLFFWGLAYGIFNEGLLAKTLITQAISPSINTTITGFSLASAFLGRLALTHGTPSLQ